MLSRSLFLIGVAALYAIGLPIASAAGEAKPEPRSAQRLIAAADDFQSAVRSVAAQPPGRRRNHAIEAADKALSDTQYAIAMERLLNASADLERSMRNMEKAGPGLTRDMAIGEADNAFYEARRALDELPRSGALAAGHASGGES